MALTQVNQGLLSTDAQYTGFKNRIINGAMVIDQRNAGASVTANNAVYGVDRFSTLASVSSKLTVQQNAGSVTPPAGYSSYLGYTSSSAYSVGASEVFIVRQRIEGLNVADFAFGTASATAITLSFWVRSSLTGTFSGTIKNSDASRTYVYSYTINAANTWEQKSVTIAGDTSGTWLTTNGIGLEVAFTMAAGSSMTGSANSWGTDKYGVTGTTSVVGTNGATFYITGVQLEKGSTATSFDYRPYGTELQLCQRYCWVTSRTTVTVISLGQCTSANTVSYILNNPVPMRSGASVSFNNQTYFRMSNAGNSGVDNSSSASLGGASEFTTRIDFTCSSSYLTAGHTSMLFNTDTSNNNGIITLSAEL